MWTWKHEEFVALGRGYWRLQWSHSSQPAFYMAVISESTAMYGGAKVTWTYDVALATPKDQIRWLCADNEATDPLVQDEEIAFVLTTQPNTYRAAAAVARQIARQFSRQATIDIATEVRINLSDRAKQYFEMAKDMEHQANVGAGGGGGLGVFVGGISTAQKQAAESAGDRVRPAFSRELHNTTTERTWTDDAREP